MSRFKELLDGYLRDSLSESELREFFLLVEENGLLPDELLIREQGFDERHEGLTDEGQREKMLLAVQMRIHEETKVRRIPAWRWVVAAAAVIMLAVAGVYLLGRREPMPVIVKAKVYKKE